MFFFGLHLSFTRFFHSVLLITMLTPLLVKRSLACVYFSFGRMDIRINLVRKLSFNNKF